MSVGSAPRPRLRLATTLALSFGLLLLLAVAVVGSIAIEAGQRSTTQVAARLSAVALDALAYDLRQHFKPAERLTAYLSNQVSEGRIGLDTPGALRDLFQTAAATAPQIFGAAYFDPRLRFIGYGEAFGGGRLIVADFGDQPNYWPLRDVAMANKGQLWMAVVWIDELNRPGVLVGTGVEREGRFAGIVTVLVGIESLSRLTADAPAALQNSYFVLHGREEVLAHPSLAGGLRGLSDEKPLPPLDEVGDPILSAFWNAPVAEFDKELGDGLRARMVETAGGRFLTIYRETEEIGGLPLVLGMAIPLEQANRIFALLDEVWFAVAAVLAVALIVALLLGRAVARPASRLATTADTIRRLALDQATSVPRSRIREIDRAAQAVNALLEALGWFLQYVPKKLVLQLMRQGRGAALPSEREITILFCDVAGFTPLAERLTAPEVAKLLNRQLTLVVAAIERHGGTVDKFMGDGTMAFWGAPEPQADHARRALTAARDLVAAVTADNARQRQAGAAPLRLRIGVNSGRAVVGDVGTDERVNYTAVGDSVNVAQRLESLGREHIGDSDAVVLCSAATLEAAGPDFPATSLGEIKLYGRDRPVTVYRLSTGA